MPLAVGALCALFVLAGCDGAAEPDIELPQHWLVYVESDYPAPLPVTVGADLLTERRRCGNDKFERVWRSVESILGRARAEGATVQVFANFDRSTVLLARGAFNPTNPEVRAILAQSGPEKFKNDDIEAIYGYSETAVKAEARQKHASLLHSAAQNSQNLIQAVQAMREFAPEAARGHSRVVVTFVSDMVHYNTDRAGHRNLQAGQLNMLDDRDRRELQRVRREDPAWWVNNVRLSKLLENVPLEVRTIGVERCAAGELLPGEAAPNWPLIREDVQVFWTETFKALGADVRWNYQGL